MELPPATRRPSLGAHNPRDRASSHSPSPCRSPVMGIAGASQHRRRTSGLSTGAGSPSLRRLSLGPVGSPTAGIDTPPRSPASSITRMGSPTVLPCIDNSGPISSSPLCHDHELPIMSSPRTPPPSTRSLALSAPPVGGPATPPRTPRQKKAQPRLSLLTEGSNLGDFNLTIKTLDTTAVRKILLRLKHATEIHSPLYNSSSKFGKLSGPRGGALSAPPISGAAASPSDALPSTETGASIVPIAGATGAGLGSSGVPPAVRSMGGSTDVVNDEQTVLNRNTLALEVLQGLLEKHPQEQVINSLLKVDQQESKMREEDSDGPPALTMHNASRMIFEARRRLETGDCTPPELTKVVVPMRPPSRSSSLSKGGLVAPYARRGSRIVALGGSLPTPGPALEGGA